MMTRPHLTVTACVTLLWAGTVLAKPTAQQRCDKARIAAWAKYVSCVAGVVAKDADGVSFEKPAAFAKCRHTYFKHWTGFQSKSALATSTCIGSRLTDNGTTVTDNLSGLVWEKQTTDSSLRNDGITMEWSTGSPWNGDGLGLRAFFLSVGSGGTGLNSGDFAGASDWRLPTLAELQSIVLDFACTGAFGGSKCQCGSSPCIDATFGPTQSDYYWSATSYVPDPPNAWDVGFNLGDVGDALKTDSHYARAVRGGF